MGKKQHIGGHNRHSYPANKGLPKEEAELYKDKPIYVDGKFIKMIKKERKTGLKFIKKFINKKRRGFLKQENTNELKILDNGTK